jgi:hypothetical protein
MSDGIWVSIGIAAAGVALSTGVSIAGFVRSRSDARKYGDLAGTNAAIAYEEEKAAKARITALDVLSNEVSRIRKLAQANRAQKQGVWTRVRLPTVAFERVLFSEMPTLLAPETLDIAAKYLAYAETVNSLIDDYLWLAPAIGSSTYATEKRNDIEKLIITMTLEFLPVLDQLEAAIEDELGHVSKTE